MKMLKDLEDALDPDEVVEAATDFREYSKIRGKLQQEVKL